MHDSMMMAEVGGIVKVSGRRIATPFAPPRPGSTPMITPSRIPTSINATLYQDNATLKPPISELISSTFRLPSFPRAPSPGIIARSLRVACRSCAWYTMCQMREERNMRFCIEIDDCETSWLGENEIVAYGIPETTISGGPGVYGKSSDRVG